MVIKADEMTPVAGAAEEQQQQPPQQQPGQSPGREPERSTGRKGDTGAGGQVGWCVSCICPALSPSPHSGVMT